MNVKPCILYKNCFALKEDGDEACARCSKSKKWEEGKLPCLIENQEYLVEELFHDRNLLRMSINDFTFYILGLLAGLEYVGYDNKYIYEDFCFYLVDKFGHYMNEEFVNYIKSCRYHE